MHDILVEHARGKAGPKRGGGWQRVSLSEALAVRLPLADDVLALHEALTELEKEDPLKGQIVHLRYFVGMNMKEVAAVLGLSERTVHRHWRFAKSWLKSRIASPD
jgi:RNA polymerase sigma factor (TIGR02999 family)